MSSDGLTVAIATDYYLGSQSAGIVKVFVYNEGTREWSQLGSNIEGTFPWQGDYFGIQASLSADGRTIAVSAIGTFTNGGAAVFYYDEESEYWYQLGDDLVGDEGEGDVIDKVFLSDDGRRVAIASTWDDKSYVYTYEYRGGNWVQLGQKLSGTRDWEQFGDSISLSPTGNLLAVGSSTRFSNSPTKGSARLYALRFNDDNES